MTWKESIKSSICQYHTKERSINQKAIMRNCVGMVHSSRSGGQAFHLPAVQPESTVWLGTPHVHLINDHWAWLQKQGACLGWFGAKRRAKWTELEKD